MYLTWFYRWNKSGHLWPLTSTAMMMMMIARPRWLCSCLGSLVRLSARFLEKLVNFYDILKESASKSVWFCKRPGSKFMDFFFTFFNIAKVPSRYPVVGNPAITSHKSQYWIIAESLRGVYALWVLADVWMFSVQCVQHSEESHGNLVVCAGLRQWDHIPRWLWNGHRHRRSSAL